LNSSIIISITAAIAFWIGFCVEPAAAHPLGPKPVAVIELNDGRISIDWLVAPDDLAAIAARLGLPAMNPSSLPSVSIFRDYFTRNVEVIVGGNRCPIQIDSVRPEPPSVAVNMTFPCETTPRTASIRISLLHDISPDYVTLAQLRTEKSKIVPLRIGSDTMMVDFADSSASMTASGRGQPGEGRIGRIAEALERRASVGPLAVAIGLAFLLGALHGVTPGHGKTITAAYLVGEGGNFRQALALGGIVTVTHALSVAILGGLAIAADQLLLPARLSTWLELAAGILIIGLGVALLRPGRPAGHTHLHHHHELPESVVRGALPIWRLALIGLAGGLIPSPEAVGVVLIAFSLDRWIAGVLLVVAFSVGLAAVVLAVAFAAVRGAKIVQRIFRKRFAQMAPRIVGTVFLAMGLIVAGRGLTRL
jgi:ABC-type nickel/cobalt efflux system permease component RcnA